MWYAVFDWNKCKNPTCVFCGSEESANWISQLSNWVFECDLLQSMAHPLSFHLLWIKDAHTLISVPAALNKATTAHQNHKSAANITACMRGKQLPRTCRWCLTALLWHEVLTSGFQLCLAIAKLKLKNKTYPKKEIIGDI